MGKLRFRACVGAIYMILRVILTPSSFRSTWPHQPVRPRRREICRDRHTGLCVTFSGHPLEKLAALSSSVQRSSSALPKRQRKGEGLGGEPSSLPSQHESYNWSFFGDQRGIGRKGNQNAEQVCRARERQSVHICPRCQHQAMGELGGVWRAHVWQPHSLCHVVTSHQFPLLPSSNSLAFLQAEPPWHTDLALLSVAFLNESPADVACFFSLGLCFPLCRQEILWAFCGKINRTESRLPFHYVSMRLGEDDLRFLWRVRGWGEGFILRRTIQNGKYQVNTKVNIHTECEIITNHTFQCANNTVVRSSKTDNTVYKLWWLTGCHSSVILSSYELWLCALWCLHRMLIYVPSFATERIKR